LCPTELSDYIAEDISFDKDSRILLAKNILINLDELSTLSRIDVNKLKSWFSKDKINERLPYDRKNSIISRRCSFMGSTNLTEFLTDETGSVRWLCFEISGIDWSYKQKVNINLVYSQAYALYRSSTFNFNMTREEIEENETRNKEYEVLSVELELIEKHFKPDLESNEINFKTASDITSRLIYITDGKFKLNRVQIGKALVSLGYERARNKNKIFGYYIQETFIN
jgi:predicted P-loop ATPase